MTAVSVGVLQETLNINQKDYFMIKNLNRLNKEGVNVSLFCNDTVNKPTDIQFNTYQKVQAFTFEGILISSDLLSLQILNNISSTNKKYYYIWYPDWMFINPLSYKQAKHILLDSDSELIVRSKYHEEIISKILKRPKIVMSDWEIKIEDFGEEK